MKERTLNISSVDVRDTAHTGKCAHFRQSGRSGYSMGSDHDAEAGEPAVWQKWCSKDGGKGDGGEGPYGK
jgi:hypothetical protein